VVTPSSKKKKELDVQRKKETVSRALQSRAEVGRVMAERAAQMGYATVDIQLTFCVICYVFVCDVAIIFLSFGSLHTNVFDQCI
jgi:hypothetical protein